MKKELFVFFLGLFLVLTPIGAQTIANSYILDSTYISEINKWYVASGPIEVQSDYKVLDPTEIRLVSGQSISFQPGFSVESGSVFVAAIGVMDDVVIDDDSDLTGSMYVSGDIVVSGENGGAILEISDGGSVYFLDGGTLYVNGELLATDATFGSALDDYGSPSEWGGIVNSGILTLDDCDISYSKQGVLQLGGLLDIQNSLITNTKIGIHIFDFLEPIDGFPDTSTLPAISGCVLADNTWYAIKEDDSGDSQVNKTIFEDNGHIYYDVARAVMTIDQLNATPNNWDNTER